MVSACPKESDPRQTVNAFVTDPSVKAIGGLVSEGLQSLMDIVVEEIKRCYPDRDVLELSREIIVDNGVHTLRDLKTFVESQDLSNVGSIVIRDEIPVLRWYEAFACIKGKGITLYIADLGCRGVPVCTKVLDT